ncbi:MAG: SagB/ThcOx family dehydrogenase [Ignavibacteria bacterium]|nr:SagB/ThcOx family dehydrogenase [Ignavibacteria bacterium]MBT8383491.1 SagB/ThcOx family dehydrogenase [Ignavibacteria bacterium]MBT8393097.1 SagB/ThcOx family dehydrogenase [Ignavibacteria bacterium]NNJ52148.1 SagB/ThcOx family dehydrogenase [Ignavibacteriaceae bacterium]NNL21901.1 SagB/ThcOx family dehydrogenase [Ignavibacteriaceae bacterium]
MQTSSSDIIELPAPNHSGKISVEEALLKRRSIRDYTDNPLSLSDISQILWAAQGITGERYDFRTAPSAGGLYPLEIYVASSNVKDLGNSLYKYRPKNNTLVKISDGDKRQDMSNAALGQDAIDNSSAIILITAVYERTSVKYGSRAERYAHIEVGAVVQNIYIQSVSIGLGTVMIGAFKDDHLKNVLNLPADEQPLAIMPLGKI